MPYCSVLECKNHSRSKNLQNGGVSYHRFPKNPNFKEKWIDATGRVNWMPAKSSTICSEHFLEDDFLITNKGYRYTKPTSLPTLNVVTVFNQPKIISDMTAPSSKRQGGSENSELTIQPKKKIRLHEDFGELHTVTENILQKESDVIPVQPLFANSMIKVERETDTNIEATSSSGCSSPRKKNLEGQLRFCKAKIEKQGKKIKQLQTKNRRLKNKINAIDELLKRLEDKFAMAEDNLDCLKNTNLEVNTNI